MIVVVVLHLPEEQHLLEVQCSLLSPTTLFASDSRTTCLFSDPPFCHGTAPHAATRAGFHGDPIIGTVISEREQRDCRRETEVKQATGDSDFPHGSWRLSLLSHTGHFLDVFLPSRCSGFPTMKTSYLAALYVLTLYLNAGVGTAMQVTSTGPQTLQIAEGLNADLGCTYTQGASDTGELDIEWSNVSPDMTQKDQLLLAFTGGKIYTYGPPSVMNRMNFSTPDPSKGDASVTISALRVSDTATYQCKVKKTPGVDTRKITVMVLVPPSVPRCWVKGGEEIGGPVSLRCEVSHGTKPLTYQWTRESGGAIPPSTVQNPSTGELLIRNHSESFVGKYMCEVKNAVGSQKCTYNLQAYQPANKTAVIVGAVIGALLLLLLLLLLIWLLICLCRKRRYEKEVANEIREDAAAPESRPASRFSSFRSVTGYRTHPGIAYSSVRKGLSRVGSEVSTIHKEGSQAAPPVYRYNSKYGYPV
ncbi:coxsackievirus and adenovirus receptor-like [Arapaima gigas]